MKRRPLSDKQARLYLNLARPTWARTLRGAKDTDLCAHTDRIWIGEFHIEDDAAMRLFNMRYPERAVVPGSYIKMVRGDWANRSGEILMSDTPAEILDHVDAVRHAHGDVLITGLGLGIIARACSMVPSVTSVTVIEMDADVIKLTGPHVNDLRHDGCAPVQIIEADALAYRPPKGVRYGMVWHDIWPTICSDNLDDFKHLDRVWRPVSDWIGYWASRLVVMQRRKEDGLIALGESMGRHIPASMRVSNYPSRTGLR